jgi:hypothetical protein
LESILLLVYHTPHLSVSPLGFFDATLVIVVDRALSIDGEDMTSNFSFGKFSEVSFDSSLDLSRITSDCPPPPPLQLMLKGYPYYLIELALYCLMGCVGGVFGALFVHINSFLSRLRLVSVKIRGIVTTSPSDIKLGMTIGKDLLKS